MEQVTHPWIASMLALSVYSIMTWWVAYRCGFHRGQESGRKKGYKQGYWDAGGDYDS